MKIHHNMFIFASQDSDFLLSRETNRNIDKRRCLCLGITNYGKYKVKPPINLDQNCIYFDPQNHAHKFRE